MQTALDKTFTQPWRWIWLVFVVFYMYVGYSVVFDSLNPVQWLVKVPLLFEQQLWGIQIAVGLVTGYLHFRGLLWGWHTISPRDQTPLRFFGGLFILFILGMVFEFVNDEALVFYKHLLENDTVPLGVLAVVWYLTLITLVVYKTVSAHIHFLSQRHKKTA